MRKHVSVSVPASILMPMEKSSACSTLTTAGSKYTVGAGHAGVATRTAAMTTTMERIFITPLMSRFLLHTATGGRGLAGRTRTADWGRYSNRRDPGRPIHS